MYKVASYLIQPGIFGHLGQRFPDDKHFRTLLSNLKLMEPGNEEVEESQYLQSVLLLVADVVCDILNEKQDCGPGCQG